MKYRYRIWCNSCHSMDPWGCFDGSSELSDERFDTIKAAAEAGYEAAKACSLWEYCVTDESGNEIEEEQ